MYISMIEMWKDSYFEFVARSSRFEAFSGFTCKVAFFLDVGVPKPEHALLLFPQSRLTNSITIKIRPIYSHIRYISKYPFC